MPPGEPPHPQALFSLVPANERAKSILMYRDNDRLVSSFRPYPNNPTVVVQGLDVGFHVRSAAGCTLAIIGRKGDIQLDDLDISPYHCSFELHEHNRGEVMLQDRSLDNSTQLFGPAAMPFKPGHPHRRVLVDQNINLLFGIGGAACDLYQFEIHWHGRDESMVRQCIDTRLGNPSHARTISYEPPTSVSCLPFGRIRYSKRERLGSGTFGEVWKVANADTGAQLAVKRIKTPRSDSYQSFSLKREVDILSRVSHTNIIKYITSQSADDGHFDIFMELKSGSVQYLITEDQLFARSTDSAYSLLFQMLQALDCLANVGMIHRDVKPENILFTPLSDGQYLYQLADFGLANLAVNAQTYAGTKPYMAPEVYQGSRQPQTVKMDIWSLFVTLAYAMNAAGFQRKPRHSREQVFKAVWEAANWVRLRQFREMAIEDPDYRATAGDMLDKAFFGEGRTTS